MMALESESTLDSRVMVSANLLYTYTEKVLAAFDDRGLSYQHFIKLAHVYASHFGMLSSNPKERQAEFLTQSGDSFYFFFQLRRPRLLSPSLLLKKESGLVSYLDSPSIVEDYHQYQGVLNRASKSQISDFGYSGHHFVLIPTMANLGFETILMAQGRHAGFLGLTAMSMKVDGETYDPVEFFFHDINHNRISGRASNDPLVTDGIVAKLQETKATDPRNYKIAIAYLFFLAHEQSASLNCYTMQSNFQSDVSDVSNFMSYDGNYPTYDVQLVRISSQVRQFHHRLRTAGDLGTAFPDRLPSEAEVLKAYGSIRASVFAVCK